ncbi:MAG: hypothetical protein M1812_007386 [Candelaria pacifica]|nr:MAG: hypothetical protein M1812_007386 [Candelaria pacifica]
MAESGPLSRGRSTSTTRTGLPSSLFSLLPSPLKGRLSRVTNIRSSAANIHKRALSGSRTPPPAYPVIQRSSDSQDNTSESGSIISGQDVLSDGRRSLSLSSEHSMPTETSTGIVWSYANNGIKLLTAAAEHSTTERLNDNDPAIGRPLYIHALTYLLRGLPRDLSLEEQLSIRAALPPDINTPLNIEVSEQQLSSNITSSVTSQCTSPPSMLHRILATGIIYLFFFFHFILPYLKFWIKSAYQYDREHHITEKLVSGGLNTADGVAKTGIEIYRAISKMGDGKIGQAMDSATAWCVAGVTGGVHEGVGEGLVIMGLRSSMISQDQIQRL